MNILFMHQSMPGQFPHLVRHLANSGHSVAFVTRTNRPQMAGIQKIEYEIRGQSGAAHPFLQNLQNGILHGEAVANCLLRAKHNGLRPDVIYGHSGWGETLYVKDVFPDVPLIHYCEFFYHPFGADTFYDPAECVRLNDVYKLRMKNSVNLLSLENCDRGITPTHWQWSQYPSEYRAKIAIIHDGIDTQKVRPDKNAVIQLPSGVALDSSQEVVTYVSRSLEPYRGFPSFMRAVEIVSRRRPACHFVIVGADGVSYGRQTADGSSFRENLLNELKIDHQRVHFLGRVPYNQYLKILQVSSLHVYLTLPFVLSWSMLEAMAAGCLVLGSDTPPVTEVLKEGENGFLVDLLSPKDIANRIEEILEKRESLDEIRNSARSTILQRYALSLTLPKQIQLIEEAAGRRTMTSSSAPITTIQQKAET